MKEWSGPTLGIGTGDWEAKINELDGVWSELD